MVSGSGTSLFLAVPAAVLGAASMGLASAAQARATKEVEVSKILDPGLLRGLVHRPLWLIGMVATGLGLALQLIALAFAPLLVVQPLLITSLIFAGMFTARLERRSFAQLDRVMISGSLVCVAGLTLFLLVARPSGDAQGFSHEAGTHPLALAVALGTVTVVALALSVVVRHGPVRVLALAVATGVLYGTTAGLMKVVAGQFRDGFAEPFQNWTLYLVCLVGPLGFLLSQNTFQQGRFLTPALAVITALDPLVGVAIGVWWLGESANNGVGALAGEGIAAIVIIVGIGMLASRAEHLARAQSGQDTSQQATEGTA